MQELKDYPSVDHLHVCLWVYYSSNLYALAKKSLEKSRRDIPGATNFFLYSLSEQGVTKTPGGVEYNEELVGYALRDLETEELAVAR